MKLHLSVFICLASMTLGYFGRYWIERQPIHQESYSAGSHLLHTENQLNSPIASALTGKTIQTFDEHSEENSEFPSNSFWSNISNRLSPEVMASIEEDINKSLFDELLETDLTYAAMLVETIVDETKKAIYVEALIEKWKEEEPYAAYQWLLANSGKIPQGNYDVYYTSILLSLAKDHPETAARFIQSMESQQAKEDLIIGIAEGWAKHDIKKAFEWLESLSNYEISANAVDESYSTIMSAFSEIDPVAASEIIEQLESEELQVSLMRDIVDNLMSADLDYAIAWTLNLSNVNARDSGITRLLSRIGGRQPDKALNILIDNHAKISGKAIDAAIWPAAEVDPEIVAGKLLDFQEEDQARVAESLITNWIRNDEEKAVQWLQLQPKGTVLEAAAAVTSSFYLYNNNPATAIEWANKIQAPQKRAELLAEIIDYTDSANLEALVMNLRLADFSAQQQLQLEEMLDRRLKSASAPLIIP